MCNKSSKSDLIIGRNSVREALNSPENIDKILVNHSVINGSLKSIILEAKSKNVLIKDVNNHKLDTITGFSNHQGIVAYRNSFTYSSVNDILYRARKLNEDAFIIISDHIEDPHNLGAIIRTAECVGAHGVIIPERRSASLNFLASKASSGAVNYIPIARVTNINQTIKYLKTQSIWVYAADMQGSTYKSVNFNLPVALVLGNEGSGVSPLVKKSCDYTVSIPMKGKISSLNVSVSAGILMYEILSQRSN